MFVGVKCAVFDLEVKSLAAAERKKSEGFATVPYLRVSVKAGPYSFNVPLVFSGRNNLSGRLDPRWYHDTLRANTLGAVENELPPLAAISAALKDIRCGFAEDVAPKVIACFNLASIDECEAMLRRAYWACERALGGEAMQCYRRQLGDLIGLFRQRGGLMRMPGDDGAAVAGERFTALSGGFGTIMATMLERHRDELQDELRLVLNNDFLCFGFEEQEAGYSWFKKAVRDWQEHYGPLWGPFITTDDE